MKLLIWVRNIVICMLVVGVLAGCQTKAPITWDARAEVTSPQLDIATTGLGNYDRKKPTRIGRHTVTMFAIPVVGIKATEPVQLGGGIGAICCELRRLS